MGGLSLLSRSRGYSLVVASRIQQLWLTGLAALWHVLSSWTADQTCVPCSGRWILNHWTSQELPIKATFRLCFRDISKDILKKINKMDRIVKSPRTEWLDCRGTLRECRRSVCLKEKKKSVS